MPNTTDILDRYGRAFANSAAPVHAGEAFDRSTDHTRAGEAFDRRGTKPSRDCGPLTADIGPTSRSPPIDCRTNAIGCRPVLNRGPGKSAVPQRYSRMGEP